MLILVESIRRNYSLPKHNRKKICLFDDFATGSLQELQIFGQQVVSAFVTIDFPFCSKIERKLTGETETVGNSPVLKDAGIVLFK